MSLSRQYSEDSSVVGGSGCAYATLSHYNTSHNMGVPRPSNVAGSYVVPVFGSPGYNALTHGAAPSCSGYFNIQSAYHSKGADCNQQYVRKLCQ